jgi:hypothetical protein
MGNKMDRHRHFFELGQKVSETPLDVKTTCQNYKVIFNDLHSSFNES